MNVLNIVTLRLTCKPDPELYKSKKQIINGLKKLSDLRAIDLRYLDESGFGLTPYVPYGWQDTEIKSRSTSNKSKRINVLGLLNRNNELYSSVFETRISSQIVRNFRDNYAGKIDKMTVVVLDNPTIHRSKVFPRKITQWSDKKL